MIDPRACALGAAVLRQLADMMKQREQLGLRTLDEATAAVAAAEVAP